MKETGAATSSSGAGTGAERSHWVAGRMARLDWIKCINPTLHHKRVSAEERPPREPPTSAGQMAFQSNILLLNAAVEAAQQGGDVASLVDRVRDPVASEGQAGSDAIALAGESAARLQPAGLP